MFFKQILFDAHRVLGVSYAAYRDSAVKETGIGPALLEEKAKKRERGS